MRKIVINICYGGFGLSEKACRMMGISRWDARDLRRDDSKLVRVIEELGDEANGDYADLKIVEIPDDVDWEIGEFDGTEWVAEKHRTWR